MKRLLCRLGIHAFDVIDPFARHRTPGLSTPVAQRCRRCPYVVRSWRT